MNGNDDYRTCFLEMDKAGLPVNSRDLHSPYCREDSLGIDEPDAYIFRVARRADMLKPGEHCLQTSLDPGTEIVVLSVSETGKRRYRDDPLRDLEVEVAGERPVVLFVQSSGGPARWNLHGKNISQVFMARSPEYSTSQMTMNGEPYTFTRLGIDTDDCPYFAPDQLELRGPTFLHLDQMIKNLLGRPIDHLVEKRIEQDDPIRILIE